MSHTCPECGQECYCDLEDHHSEAPDDCCHDCDLDDDEEVSFSGEVSFPKPSRNDGGKPCGECHLHPGETCDICGAIRRSNGETT